MNNLTIREKAELIVCHGLSCHSHQYIDVASAYLALEKENSLLSAQLKTLDALLKIVHEERDAAHEVLRSLACWLSVGGYNAEEVDAKSFEKKIREGVDTLVRVETARARGPQISDSEEKALLRRVNRGLIDEIKFLYEERDKYKLVCDSLVIAWRNLASKYFSDDGSRQTLHACASQLEENILRIK